MRRDYGERERRIARSKMTVKDDKLRSWKENKAYKEIERKEEHGLSTRWIMTKKLKNREEHWKARLVV